jgi:glycosyltransferase involved in cell wall biosynthesis
MRAIHIVAGLDPRHGGPAYSVPRLCEALHTHGTDVRILTVREANTPLKSPIAAYPQDFSYIPLLRSLRISSGLANAARMAARDSDLVHVHGLWLMPNVYAGHAAEATGRPLVVTPRGMLAPEALAFSARKKRLFWRLLQKSAYVHAAVWHATCEAEADEIRAFGIRAPIAIIPNGIDIPRSPVKSLSRQTTMRTILFLGRLHPKKGLPDLIAAWSRLANERPDWTLRIVGTDEGGHRLELEKMVQQGGVPRVVFDCSVHGAEKARVLQEADVFVLPTQNENFGLAVAEALAAGAPAIVSHGAPWSGLETERCGWWVKRGAEALFEALREATALPDAERHAMGLRGRAWMAKGFDWESVAAKMLLVYQWVTGSGLRPDFVTPC